MIVRLDWPSEKLFPNQRISKRYLNSTIQDYRYQAKITTLQQKKDAPKLPTHITITFFPPDRRRHDLDNCIAAVKAAIDGIYDALGCDDSIVTSITIQKGAVVKNGEVIFEL